MTIPHIYDIKAYWEKGLLKEFLSSMRTDTFEALDLLLCSHNRFEDETNSYLDRIEKLQDENEELVQENNALRERLAELED